MKKSIYILLSLCLIVLSGCSSESRTTYNDGFLRAYESEYGGYVYPINFIIENDERWEFYRSDRVAVAGWDETYTIKELSKDLNQYFKDYYEDPDVIGKLFIGWEDEDRNLIDENNPLVIEYDEAKKNPIKVYARFESVSIFYKIINGSPVTHDLANYAFDSDIESIISYLKNSDFTYEELVEIMSVLLRVYIEDINYDEDEKFIEAFYVFEEVYNEFNLRNFQFIIELFELNIDWSTVRVYVGKEIIDKTKDRTELRLSYKYVKSGTTNTTGSLSYTISLSKPLYEISARNNISDSCSPSVNNCQYYKSGSSYSQRLFVNAYPSDNLRGLFSYSDTPQKLIHDNFIELWIEFNSLMDS